MNIQSALPLVFEFLGRQRVEVERSEAPLSSDAGLLPIREFDRRLGWTEGFAAQLIDHRQTSQHALVEMVRQRVFGILAGYEDQNDHDTLRCDPVFKLVAGRSPDGQDLAGQPTLSRFENAQLLPGLSARAGLQSTGAAQTPGGRSTKAATRGRRHARGSPLAASEAPPSQPASSSRPAGRRPRLHLANHAHQGRRHNHRLHAPHPRAPLRFLALRKLLPDRQPSRPQLHAACSPHRLTFPKLDLFDFPVPPRITGERGPSAHQITNSTRAQTFHTIPHRPSES